jgi:hypothetical protein
MHTLSIKYDPRNNNEKGEFNPNKITTVLLKIIGI